MAAPVKYQINSNTSTCMNNEYAPIQTHSFTHSKGKDAYNRK